MVASTVANLAAQAAQVETARDEVPPTKVANASTCSPAAEGAREAVAKQDDELLYCPVTTTSRTRPYTVNDESIELRAYKLGKGKCSYNMVQLNFLNQLTNGQVDVVEASEVRHDDDENQELAESSVRYELTLQNFSKILLDVYIVYSVPVYSEKTADGKDEFKWKLVKRKYCKRGCKGPILRSIQRFGKLGRRCSEIWSSTNFQQVHQEQTAMQSPQSYGSAKKEDAKKGPSKNHKSLFISIDEACTHVSQGDKKCRFRLLFGVTDAETGEKIGAAVSAPIRVLANNDAPNGAAYIHMPIPLANSWKGWKGLITRRDLGLPLDVDLAPTTPDSAHPETRLDGKRKIDRLPITGGGPGVSLPLKKRTKQMVESPQTPQNLSPIEQARASMTSAMTVPMTASMQSPPIPGLQMQQNPFLLSPANIQNLHQMMYFYNLAAMAAAGGNPGGLN